MSGYKLGLVSVSFRGNSPEEIAAAARDAGLECIEWGSDVHAPCGDIGRLDAIVRIQREYGLYCCSYGTYFRLGVTPLDELADYIAAAERLGTNVLRLWCGRKGSGEYTPEEKERFFADCRAAADIAEKSGALLCMECHNNTFTDRLDGALEVLRAVDSPSFRMYWQPNQFRTPEENVRYAAEIARFTERLHVFNWEGEGKFPLRDGKGLWKKYLEKFPKDSTLLLEFMPDGRIESLKGEAKALFEIVEEEK